MFKLVVALILIAAVTGLSRLDFFKVKTINCRLNHYPCPMSLEPILLSFVGKNIFTFKTAAAGRQLNSFDPTLTEIKVTKRLPNRLNIDLIRRLAIAEIKADSATYYLDKTGFIYALPALVNQPLPQVWWPQGQSLNPGMSDIGRELARLINTLDVYYVKFTRVSQADDSTYEVVTQLGPKALVSPARDFAAAVGSLQFILTNLKIEEKLPAKIDLRFDKPILTY